LQVASPPPPKSAKGKEKEMIPGSELDQAGDMVAARTAVQAKLIAIVHKVSDGCDDLLDEVSGGFLRRS